MARKPRIHYEGALYHVICRGNNKEYIFENEEDKEEYRKIIIKYKKKYGFTLYAYCIMDNHVHMLIEVEKIPLSKIMKGIQQVYTQRYNKKYERTGHVFEQRYKAQLCKKNEYLLNLIRYIHKNPVKAKLNKGINYNWSSHNEYLNKANLRITDVKFPLECFSYNNEEAIKRYLLFMGEEESIDKEKWQIDQNEVKQSKNYQNKEKKIKFLEIIKCIEVITGINIEDVKGSTKNRRISDIRKAIIILNNKYGDYNNKMVSEYLQIDPTTVSQIVNGRYSKSELLTKIIEEFIQMSSCHA
ncbi:transposase [Maledivibacter halophilus]|uniref:REP element-mobilizing transposase RayT n=1 Tax=Maledivibacter halophilus TaxID=36842 RepID=A0A1T5ME27_9FIRM|nr:transposase [Maledivibacter halophilus]SKC86491.1 REP element-mobilizing transposase RayT [Maledivibacter halophilus]